jgi:hypothetical protein
MAIEFYFTPELHLKDGRIIRDAASFAQEQIGNAIPAVSRQFPLGKAIPRVES